MTNHLLHSIFQLNPEAPAEETDFTKHLDSMRRIRGADDPEYVFLQVAALSCGLIEREQLPVFLEVPNRISSSEIDFLIETSARNLNFECLTTFALYSTGQLQSGAVERLKWLSTEMVVNETIAAVTRGFAVAEKDKVVRRSLVSAKKLLKHHAKQIGKESLKALLAGFESALVNKRLATFETLVTSAVAQKRIDALLEEISSDSVEALTRILVELPSSMPNLTPARQTLIQMMSRIPTDQRSNDQRIWEGLKGLELVQLFSNKGIRSWTLGDPQHESVVSILSEYVLKASVAEIVDLLLVIPELDDTQALSQLTSRLGRASREGFVLNRIVHALSTSTIESTVAAVVAEHKSRFDHELQELKDLSDSIASQLQRQTDRANELEIRLRETIQTKTEHADVNSRRASFEVLKRYVAQGQETCDLAQLNYESQQLMGSLVSSFIASLRGLGIERVGEVGQPIDPDPSLFDISGQVKAGQVRVLQPAFCDITDRSIIYRRGIAVFD